MVKPRRISVVGTAGSGKSTLARRISVKLGVPHIELDAIHHQADWTPMPENEFRAAVAERLAPPAWVADGNYHRKLDDLVWRHADTVIWFDLPRARVMRQLVGRTVSRALHRRELWNGNRENWRNILSRDPARSVIAWGWHTHAPNRERYLAAVGDPAYRHIAFVRIGSHRDADALLDTLQADTD